MAASAQTAGDRFAFDLRWLVQMRWAAVLGQSSVVLLVDRLLGFDLALRWLFAIIAVETASNVGCMLWLRRLRAHTHGHVPDWALAAILAFDVVLLTALLHLSGGSFNPFNFLYLVHIALAAVILRPRWAWGLAVLSLTGFATLFVEVLSLEAHSHLDHAAQMQMHLQGMWVAFGVAAGFIVFFVGRIRRALADRDAQLVLARERSARSDKLASLATLAAGAAHELSTPLATIAVVAGEIDEAITQGRTGGLLEDARLIRDQVRRCRAVLDQMATDAGDSPGEVPDEVPLRTLLEAAANGAAVLVENAATDVAVRIPFRATVQALRGLVDNAVQASPPGRTVTVAGGREGSRCWVEVRDQGTGMSEEVLTRVGEPFFTTKEPGAGMGLGVFLAHALADRLGGRLDVDSALGQGTTVRLTLPCESDATNHHIARERARAEY